MTHRSLNLILILAAAFCLFTPALSAASEDEDAVTFMVTIKKWTAGKLPMLGITGSVEQEEPPSTFEKVKKIAEDWKLAGTTAATVAGSAVTSALGTAAGFTATGIVKGSLAATLQSYIGTSVVFSTLQSIGASGGMAMLGPAGLVGGAAAGLGYYLLG